MAVYYEGYYGVCSLGSGYLMHHGIKGMKWGVRRFQNEDGSYTEAGKRRRGIGRGGERKTIRQRISEAREKRASTNTKSIQKSLSSMSDDELVARIGRLKKEKELLDLRKSVNDYGLSTSQKILRTAGVAAATTLATAGVTYGGKVAIKRILDKHGVDGSQVIKDMFPKKK